MVRIYSPELQLNKANASNTKAPFSDVHLSVSNGFISCKIYDKLDVIIATFFLLDGDGCSPFYHLRNFYFLTYSIC